VQSVAPCRRVSVAAAGLAFAFLPAAPPRPADAGPAAPGGAVIEVGRENWERPWVPDFQDPVRTIPIPAENRIDVAILGDGYLAGERAKFEEDVKAWYERFLTYTPWKQFRGAFRVRGLWTPGEGRATPDRRSYYRIPATTSGTGDVSSRETAAAIFDALDRLGVNPARRGRDLTHAVPVMLVRNERGWNPSGLTRNLVSPDGGRRARVAFAAYTHHEFGHAFGALRDEYILKAGTRATHEPPARPGLFTASNIAYSSDRRILPWAHLAPGSEANPDPASVIGVCWIGGIQEERAWHSEARCLMNGTHENWDLQKSRRGVNLRDHDRFCFWCEELLVARTLALTGRLGGLDDDAGLWARWLAVRPLYQRAFRVPDRIREQNRVNAGTRLDESKLYVRPSVL
jgi:hypothetical protein